MEPDFLTRLQGNSLDRVELVISIEDVLGGYLSPEDERKIRGFRTIQEAIDYVKKRRADGGLN